MFSLVETDEMQLQLRVRLLTTDFDLSILMFFFFFFGHLMDAPAAFSAQFMFPCLLWQILSLSLNIGLILTV